MSEQDNGNESEQGPLDSITEALQSIRLKYMSGGIQRETEEGQTNQRFAKVCPTNKYELEEL